MSSVCKACGKPIKFIRTKSGRWEPCDLAKHSMIKGDGGTMCLVTDAGEVFCGYPASREDGANCSGYISHFATCAGADGFRKKKRLQKRQEDKNEQGIKEEMPVLRWLDGG